MNSPSSSPSPQDETDIKLLQRVSVTLKNFTDGHPDAQFKAKDGKVILTNPWSDSSLNVVIDETNTPLLDTLNSVYLPRKYTAIYHKTSRSLEVIWTAYPVSDEFKNRSFTFSWKGTDHDCSFSGASEAVMLLAEHYEAAGAQTPTNHRNLNSFKSFIRWKQKNPEIVDHPYFPISFWIHNIDWEDTAVLDLCKHLNFYMFYFDRDTPKIVIHEDPLTEKSHSKTLRFPFEAFPPLIRGRQADAHLLGLFDAANEAGDVFRKFLHYYQILEYAAFYYVDDKIDRVIRRTILSPECASHPDQATKAILDVMTDWRIPDEAKIVAAINHMVDPQAIWKEVEPLKEYFSKAVKFDGGFSMPPLIKEDWTVDDFCTAWTPKLPDAFRKIRNALVHSREARMVAVISPTPMNVHRLRPWIFPLSLAAMQIIIFNEE